MYKKILGDKNRESNLIEAAITGNKRMERLEKGLMRAFTYGFQFDRDKLDDENYIKEQIFKQRVKMIPCGKHTNKS